MNMNCPNTGKSLNLPDQLAGRSFRCPACGENHTAPDMTPGPKPRSSFGTDTRSNPPVSPDLKPASPPSRMPTGSRMQPAAHAPAASHAPKPAGAAAGVGGSRTRAGEEGHREARPRRERQKKEPMSSRTKMTIAGVAALVVLLVGGGVWWQVSSERARIREQAKANIAEVEKAVYSWEPEAAEKLAQTANDYLDKNRAIFRQDDLASYQTVLKRGKDASGAIKSAKGVIEEEKDDLKGLISSLNVIRDRDVVKADLKLDGMIRGKLESLILGDANTIAGEDAAPEAVFARLNEFKGEFGGNLGSEKAAELDKLIATVVAEGGKKLKSEAEGVFKKISSDLAGDNAAEAFTAHEEMSRRLKEIPAEIAGTVPANFESAINGFREGKTDADAGSLDISAADRKQAVRMFELAKVIDSAREREDELGSRRLLRKMREDVSKMEGVSGPVRNYLASGIEQSISKLDELDRYIESKAQSAGGSAKMMISRFQSAAKAAPGIKFVKGSIKPDSVFEASLIIDGTLVTMKTPRVRINEYLELESEGYRFKADWTMMFYRPFVECARLAKLMKETGVQAGKYGTWELFESAGTPVAISRVKDDIYCFFKGELCKAEDEPNHQEGLIKDFEDAAKALHQGIIADETMPKDLRNAMSPVLNATYGQLNPQDHLDGDFCRRLVAEKYLERNIPELSEAHKFALDRFRSALTAIGYDRPQFTFALKDGTKVSALRSVARDLSQDKIGGGDQDSYFKEPKYSWRVIDAGGNTSFAKSMPERTFYSLFLVTTYEGQHKTVPDSAKPLKIEVVHSTEGMLASYKLGDAKAEGSPEKWTEALAMDLAGLSFPGMGEPGWGFGFHVPVFDSSGRARAIATEHGVLPSSDFSKFENPGERKAKQDEWLDKCAAVLATPGQLNLFFRHFAKYSLDSPISTNPRLIGSQSGSGDHHQTVYQLLDRKVAGCFLGDCDDLAEFFQVVTRRQGKLSHVFAFPGHAACGYADVTEKTGGGKRYSLVFLQTGPALIFTADSLDDAVKAAFRRFDDEGRSNFTVESIPFLFRFANEETRTGYLLSDRILVDPEYADTMIRVQSYWHFHYYSTGMKVMKEMLKNPKDQTPSNYSELAGLYTFASLFPEALEMRKLEIKAANNNAREPGLQLHALLGILRLHLGDKNDAGVKEILGQMMPIIQQVNSTRNIRNIMQLSMVRVQMALAFSEIGDFQNALGIIGPDIQISLATQQRLAEHLVSTLVGIYSKLRKEEVAGTLNPAYQPLGQRYESLLQVGFANGYFQADDDFNALLRKYGTIGQFAIAKLGEKSGIEKLLAAGPYPDGKRNHIKRSPGVTEDDWKWFRICPTIRLSLAGARLDKEEPQDLDPETALKLLDSMPASFEAGKKIGSMIVMEGAMITAEIIGAILKQDVEAIRKCFAKVRQVNISDQYDAAATAFGAYCGYLPLEKMPEWMELFHANFPGKQHYFKVAYRAIDANHFDHALAAAEATVKFFPDVEAMAQELEHLRGTVKLLKEREAEKAKAQESKKAK